MEIDPHLYGLIAEFESSEALLSAAQQAYQAGYRKMDAYSPFPVEGLAQAVGAGRTWLSEIILSGGILGGLLAYGMMWYSSVISYPLNSGGKPANSWPAFIPITFELTILGAATFALLGMLALNGLPEPYHPVFNLESFSKASQDSFFLSIEARDPQFDPEKTRQFLESLDPVEVSAVDK